MAPGIGHSPGRGAAGAALNKKGKSEHELARSWLGAEAAEAPK
jgi:hypothetical protein